MSVDTGLLFEQNVVETLSQSQQEPEWMLQLRLNALKTAASLPLPKVEKTRIDRWNFTSFQPYTPAESLSGLSQLPEEIRALLSSEAQDDNVIVQKNSSPVYRYLQSELAEKGVIFQDLASAVREHPELVKRYFMTDAVRADEHRLAALHAALWSGGFFLYVPRNVQVDLPFQSLFWAEGSEVGMLPHVLVVAEDNSRVDLVVNFVSDKNGTTGVNNSIIETFVGSGAHVRVATVNNMGDQIVDTTYRRAIVDRDGRMEWIVGDLGTGRVISDNTTHLKGDGGSVDVKTIAVGTDETRANITSTVHHWGKATESDINARGVMKDQASSIINGITKIEKGAKQANGQQAEKVLMLNREARGDANPILLIDENDVKAGHAASVGRVDELQLFYLMARGIPRQEAEKLIIFGFLSPVLAAIPIEALRERLHGVIERKFGR
jgi:Fe-S cluster assembly protein SufD